MPSKSYHTKVTDSAKAVQNADSRASFTINGTKVNGEAVLREVVVEKVEFCRRKIRSLMTTRKNHQVRNQCVIEGISPYEWRILKGDLHKTRGTKGGKKVYTLDSIEEAEKCLLFKNFSFQSKKTTDYGPRIYKWLFYTQHYVQGSRRALKSSRKELNAIRILRGQPTQKRWVIDSQKNPTLVYDPTHFHLKIQFDFQAIDPTDTSRRLMA